MGTEPRLRSPEQEFAHVAMQGQTGMLREIWEYSLQNKKWWLTPIILALLLVGLFIILGSTAAAPFIYTLF